jgi:N-acetylmuramoyl-L-alanine amidase
MRYTFNEKLRLLTQTASLSGLKIHLKFWWYRRDQSRLLVLLLLICFLFSAGLLVRYAVAHQAELKQLHCLALNIYHEARGEPVDGQYAVAEVTMNRVASSRYPDTICEVVFEKRWDSIRERYVGAFSWTEIEPAFDGNTKAWQRAKRIASEFIASEAESRVNGAIFYHARYIKPSWSRKRTVVARIGKHIFYK